ncbi:hypothetical protein FQN50_008414 [Emmonsiellopsis sp. PD_5]|nr:hypothetical protein FQN50_008414 [Emmonsiellopsis sp. PD_5]
MADNERLPRQDGSEIEAATRESRPDVSSGSSAGEDLNGEDSEENVTPAGNRPRRHHHHHHPHRQQLADLHEEVRGKLVKSFIKREGHIGTYAQNERRDSTEIEIHDWDGPNDPENPYANFATLVVTRFFGGGASSVSINIVGGSISDVWRGAKARSLPMSLFGFTSVIGIALGPFIGSAIQTIHKKDPWRWIWYIQIIYNAGLIPIFYLILRETRSDIILKRRAQKIRKQTGKPVYAQSEVVASSIWKLLQISFERPARMLLTEPVVIFFTLWISFAWGILFLFFSSVVQTFSANYGFDTFQTGLIQLAISVGALIGTVVNPLQDWLYIRSARYNKQRPGKPLPEARLYTSLLGSLIFTGGLFWYGWSSKARNHWIVPTCGVAATGLGIYSIYMAVVNYLTDAYEKYAASALSAASLGRNTFGAFLPLASFTMFQNLGFGWAGSLLGFIGLILSVVPWLLVFYGPEIRKRSPFMKESTFSREDSDEVLEKRSSDTTSQSRC